MLQEAIEASKDYPLVVIIVHRREALKLVERQLNTLTSCSMPKNIRMFVADERLSERIRGLQAKIFIDHDVIRLGLLSSEAFIYISILNAKLNKVKKIS